MIEEQKKIRIIVIMGWLKDNINPSYGNEQYVEWMNRPKADKKIKFRNWVIQAATKSILKELDDGGKK